MNVQICPDSTQKGLKLRKRFVDLKLFSATGWLESMWIEIIGERFGTKRGHRNLLVITKSFTKPVHTIPLRGVTAVDI